MSTKRILLVTLLLSLCAGMLPAQTVDEILAKNFASRGGLDKLQSVRSMKMTGKIVLVAQGNMEMPITVLSKKPDCIRNEMTFQGKEIVQSYDGKDAWWIMPFSGSDAPQPMPEDQAKEFKNQASEMESPFINYKAKGYTIDLEGKEDMEGTEVYKLKLTRPTGKVTTYFLDADTGIELKAISTVKRGDNDMTIETILGDYKPVDGIMFPFSIENKVGDTTMSRVVIDTIEINPSIDDAIFHMPPKKEAPAEPAKQ